ncbi:MAG: TRAP transporter fused permease subunit, partial [Firmicutes bacterium]|nr:TRAP transporter fused permease subunit [Bacillota bacterium]
SGTVAANVAATGSITIPLMKRIGYKPEFAAGVEAVASNGGQLMPPIMGVVAFVMAEMTGIPYVKIIAAALIPAILYYIALFTQVDLEAVKLKLKGLPRQELPEIKQVLLEGWFYIVPLIVLIVAMAVFRITPERSAFYAIVTLILLVILNGKFSIGMIVDALENAGKAMCVVVIACATAGLILGTISTTGVGINLAIAIERISAGNVYLILLLTAISCFVLGTGLDTISIYFMLSTLISPLLVDNGIPLMAAHLFVVYFGLVSFITPPVAVAAFIAAGLAESNPMKTAVTATRLGICTFIIPFLFVLNPELLMIGSGGDIALAFITAVIGVFVLSMGVVGRVYYDMGEIPLVIRIVLIGCALLMMQPGAVTDLIGISVTGLMIWLLYRRNAKHSSIMEGVR